MSTALVVDDEPDVAAGLAELLRLEGWDTIEVHDGLEALAALELRPVDVVVSDVMMPRMRGDELLRRLRADARWSGIPFVLLSAAPVDPAAADLATLVVVKPPDVDALLESLHAFRR